MNPSSVDNRSLSDAGYYPPTLQSPATARILVRALNVLMTCASLVLVYATTRHLSQGQAAPLLAAALLGFEPNTLYVTSVISNDALLLLIAALYCYIIVRMVKQSRPSVWEWVGIGVGTIAAILTRLNGWVLLPVTVLVMLMAFRSGYWIALSVQTRRRWLLGVALLLTAIGAIVLINTATMGSLFGRYRGLNDMLSASIPKLLSLSSTSAVFISVLRDTGGSYLSSINFINHPHLVDAFGWFTLLTLGVGLGSGLLLTWRRHRRSVVLMAAALLAACILVFIRNIGALGVTTSYSTTLIFAPLRYYVPGFPAAAILIGLGLTRFRVFAGLGLLLILSWIAVLVLSPAYQTIAPQPPLLSAAQAAALPVTETSVPNSGNFPKVLTSQFTVDQTTQTINLHLVTATDQHLTDNDALRLDFLDPQGKAASCQFPVANGQYPTLWWKVGDLVETQMKIPDCTRDLPAGTQMSLRWIGNGVQSAAIPIGHLDAALTRSPSCPPFLGSVADNLLIVQYTAPLIAHTGTVYLPSVNWYMQGSTSAYTRSYTFTHVNSGVEYTCDGQPRLNTFPFSDWNSGSIIYFDECAFTFPADAPLGQYRVSVTTRDQAGNVLAAADQAGQPAANSRVEVATIQLMH